MATIREIKRRIRSVRNISQVTKAMQMVAAAKMRRAQEQVMGTRPYAQKAWQLLTHLAVQAEALAHPHPLLEVRPVQTVGLVLITADKGLCGGYNHNIIRRAIQFIEEQEHPVKVIAVGRKGRDVMWRARYDLIAEFTGLPALPSLADVTPIARTVIEDFTAGKVDEVYLAYTDFINTLVQRPAIRRLLPLRPSLVEEQAMREYVEGAKPLGTIEYIYEPDPSTILNTVLPRFTELQVYQAVLESIASEHSARMVAMRNATENAEDLIVELTLTYNKARQQAITREIVDIASGAEALSKAFAAAR